MTNEELQEIKDRLAKVTQGTWIWEGIQVDATLQLRSGDKIIIPSCTLGFHDAMLIMHAPDYLAALIVEVERLRAIIAANPVRRKSVQKRIAVQVLDAVADERHITPPRPEDILMEYKCEHCGGVEADNPALELKHRGCRMKAAFPGAYTEQADGLVAFDMERVAESLGMFSDIVVGRDGQLLHPMEGDLHFRVSAGWLEPEVWIELPVRVGNRLSSWSYRVTLSDWVNLVDAVNNGIKAAEQYLQEAGR